MHSGFLIEHLRLKTQTYTRTCEKHVRTYKPETAASHNLIECVCVCVRSFGPDLPGRRRLQRNCIHLWMPWKRMSDSYAHKANTETHTHTNYHSNHLQTSKIIQHVNRTLFCISHIKPAKHDSIVAIAAKTTSFTFPCLRIFSCIVSNTHETRVWLAFSGRPHTQTPLQIATNFELRLGGAQHTQPCVCFRCSAPRVGPGFTEMCSWTMRTGILIFASFCNKSKLITFVIRALLVINVG